MSEKSAFSVFLNCHRTDKIKKRNKTPSWKELATKLSPIWNNMNDDEKEMYKVLARKSNSSLDENQPSKPIRDIQKYSNDFWNMQKHLTEMFTCIPNNAELLNKKFFLLHINCHTLDEEEYYFPAEIAALEFNLKNGLSRTYHQVIGISKIYPRGFAGGMRQFSDNFHQISCFNEHPDDYQKILLEFLTFLKDGVINQADLQEGTLDLPYLFTIESEVGMNIMKAKSSLERLYSTAFPKVEAERLKSIFKIGSTEKLLLEIQKKFNLHLNPQYLTSKKSVHDILELDMYGCGLGCQYHEMRGIAYRCSKARILQWMSNICKYLSSNTCLRLIPGRHAAIELQNGSKMMLENSILPLSTGDLILDTD